MPIKMSIIIPTRNKGRYLNATLHCLASNNLSNCEIIIVNNQSTDNTTNIINNAKAFLPIVEVKCVKIGRASARNEGVKYALGDLLHFLDDDILVKKNYIESHLNTYTSYKNIVRSRIVDLIEISSELLAENYFNKLQYELIIKEGYNSGSMRLFTNPLESFVNMMYKKQHAFNIPWLAGSGTCITYSREIWSSLAGFDEKFNKNWGCEDLEFAYRAYLAGGRFMYIDKIISYHSAPQINYNRWNNHQANLELFYSLHQAPEIYSLKSLLCYRGSVKKYIQELAKIDS